MIILFETCCFTRYVVSALDIDSCTCEKKQAIINSHPSFGSKDLRGTFAGISDQLSGRIPLAYAHFVQVLVDSFLLIAPVALYSELGVWCIPAVGLLTLFYAGLLDLAKILLDPFDNDEFYEAFVNVDVGVLIREGNTGSTRWKYSAETLPFATNVQS